MTAGIVIDIAGDVFVLFDNDAPSDVCELRKAARRHLAGAIGLIRKPITGEMIIDPRTGRAICEVAA